MAEEAKKEVKKTESKPAEPVIAGLTLKSRFVRTAPDKIRFLSKAVIGKEIEQAINLLEFSNRSAKVPLISILKNGLSQAKEKDIQLPLYIKSVAVNEGPKLKRRRIVHQGRATAILKRQSHILITLTGVNPKRG